jgi:hypothetical protein
MALRRPLGASGVRDEGRCAEYRGPSQSRPRVNTSQSPSNPRQSNDRWVIGPRGSYSSPPLSRTLRHSRALVRGLTSISAARASRLRLSVASPRGDGHLRHMCGLALIEHVLRGDEQDERPAVRGRTWHAAAPPLVNLPLHFVRHIPAECNRAIADWVSRVNRPLVLPSRGSAR